MANRVWLLGMGKEFNKEAAVALIRLALDLGVNLVDTAETYGGGLSEVVGEAVKDVRDEVIIATKLWITRLTYRSVIKALNNSLKRLKTKYVDVYQVHWPVPFIFLKNVFRALEHFGG